ncbi:MAG: LysR family transcriptional regulator [Pseudomonadota bacterium]|nr:LysR family transcriptional regulator [Pseudomonadota bacterium]MEE3098476.1 LysR family transcriptional regulator [Pseudomonadota bacterium]
MSIPPLPPCRITLRLVFEGGAMLGPGKAALLEGIRDRGSIAAAGRAMGMSYKRAWTLVEEMNAAFRTPLVERVRGGARGGGAALTGAGSAALAHYRAFEANAALAGAADIEAIAALLPGGAGRRAEAGGDGDGDAESLEMAAKDMAGRK